MSETFKTDGREEQFDEYVARLEAKAKILDNLNAGKLDLADFAGITPGEWFYHGGNGKRVGEVRSRQDTGKVGPCPVVNWSGFDDSDRPLAEHEANARAIAAVPRMIQEIRRQRAQLAERDAECARLRGAIKLRLNDWASVASPGAAAEGCPDPEDVAAMKAALAQAKPC